MKKLLAAAAAAFPHLTQEQIKAEASKMGNWAEWPAALWEPTEDEMYGAICDWWDHNDSESYYAFCEKD